MLITADSSEAQPPTVLDETNEWTVTPGWLTAPDGSRRRLVGSRLDRASTIAKTIDAASPPPPREPTAARQPNVEDPASPLVAEDDPDGVEGRESAAAQQPAAVEAGAAGAASGAPRAVRVMAPRQVMRRYEPGWGVGWHEVLSLIARDPALRRQLDAHRADVRARRAVEPILVDRSEGVVLEGVLRLAAAALEGEATVAVMDHTLIAALMGESAPAGAPLAWGDPRQAPSRDARPLSSSWLGSYVSQ